MKRKTLTLVLCLLTVMSLVGVGFASWVINANASEDVSGNIVVDTVSDERYNISVDVQKKDIIFAAPANSDKGNNPDAWLTSDGAKGTATLEVVYTFTVTKKDGKPFSLNQDGNALSDLFIKVDFVEPSTKKTVTEGETQKEVTTNYQEAKDAKLISLINVNGYEVSKVTLDSNKTTATFIVKIGYKWGDAFGGVNPFDYYKAKDANDETATDSGKTWADDAYEKLTVLSKIDASCSYSATVIINRTQFEGATAGSYQD